MPGLDPPAGPKPLRRGEGPGIHALITQREKDVDGRVNPGHDEEKRASGFDASACDDYVMRS
jgi:hypothetical protein